MTRTGGGARLDRGARRDVARSPLRAAGVTSIGSLPHRDADAAADFVLRHHPALPAAPQLPRRSPLEGMVAQAARGIQGVEIDAGGKVTVEVDALDPAAPVRPAMDGAGHGGLLAFLARVAGRTDPVKLQLTGPVTLGMALVDAGAPADLAFPVASGAVRSQGRMLVELCRRRLPEAPLLVFLDEPGLAAPGRDRVPLSPEAVIDLVSGALAVLEGQATTGVHCCGPTDWQAVSAAGPTVVSVPASARAVADGAGALAAHLDRGGWVAWGAVPTAGPVGTDIERLWRRLSDLWDDLVVAGADPDQLHTQCLVTPACGLAGHGESQARRALELTSQLSARVADPASGADLSLGEQ